MMPAMIAVGTVIAHRPRTDPDGPNSGIRFLPRVVDGKSHIWPGVEVSRLRKPVAGQPRHPLPREAILLAAAPQRAVPEPCHVAMECGDRRTVRGNRVIGKVASDDLCQPTSLFGYWLVHALTQFLLYLRELRTHAIAPTLAMNEELTVARLPANEDKAQELEGLRLAKSRPCASVRRMAAKLDQAGLVRVQRKRELLKPRAQCVPEASGVGLELETDNKSSSGEGSHLSALTEPDGTLSRHPALTPQPPVARLVPTRQIAWGPAARC